MTPTAPDTTRPLLVLDVVGLTPRLLPHMPRLRSIADSGFEAGLRTVFPAVTCSVQASLLTGSQPRDHGIVGNGWCFRDLGEVFLWRQHNALVQGEKVWMRPRAARPGYRVANICWWYAMGAATELTVTPRPVYYADGKKSPDRYTTPPGLHDELTAEAWARSRCSATGGRPLASRPPWWIASAAGKVLTSYRPDLTLVYLPHLDYDLQRFGPDGPQAVAAAAELDVAIGVLLDTARAAGARVIALSEYGITAVSTPVDINRALRREGLLAVHNQAGMEYLDPWTSRAFAVADHQVAHVYVRDPADLPKVTGVLSELPGVAELLGPEGKARYGIDHERAGELVAVAEPDAWFTYYYWLDEDLAPDFARTVEIHRKPGYDPAELFFNPQDPLVKARTAAALARKQLGLRYTMQVVPLDPAPVRGSHGRLPDEAKDAPVLLRPGRAGPGGVFRDRSEAAAAGFFVRALTLGPPQPCWRQRCPDLPSAVTAPRRWTAARRRRAGSRCGRRSGGRWSNESAAASPDPTAIASACPRCAIGTSSSGSSPTTASSERAQTEPGGALRSASSDGLPTRLTRQPVRLLSMAEIAREVPMARLARWRRTATAKRCRPRRRPRPRGRPLRARARVKSGYQPTSTASASGAPGTRWHHGTSKPASRSGAARPSWPSTSTRR